MMRAALSLAKQCKFIRAQGTNITRFQWVEPSLHDSKLLLRDRADWRDKPRRNFPKEDMDLGGNEKYMFSVVHHLILERVIVLLWVCLWSIQIILMYTCMLKIISPPFYCAVMLMNSRVTFYFITISVMNMKNPNVLVICKLPQCSLFGLTLSLLYNLIGQLFHFFSFS